MLMCYLFRMYKCVINRLLSLRKPTYGIEAAPVLKIALVRQLCASLGGIRLA